MAILNNSNAISTAGGYDINNSLRFRSSASAYLNRTLSTPTDNKKWTYSTWIKRGSLTTTQVLLATASEELRYIADGGASGVVDSFQYNAGAGYGFRTNATYRDVSAWYHILVAVDTTQATAANRARIYINGVEASTDGTYNISQNTNTQINSAVAHNIGRRTSGSLYFDGYQAETYFVDGQQLTPSSFGETDTTTGVWKPKAYTGTYGTNGFYLKFSDIATTSGSNAGLGKDFSGNSNYWTTNNISVTSGTTYDAMTDSPTLTSATVANYCVLNPLGAVFGTPTFSNANLTVTATAGNDRAIGTIFVSSGKWYWEATAGTVGSTSNVAVASDTIGGYAAAYRASGGTLNLTGSPTFNSYTSGDIIGVALDIDSGTVAFYKNGVQQGTGFYTYTASSLNMYGHLTYFASTGTGNSFNLNFGQRPFSYTPPTGYKALNTYNLPTPTILKGNKYMDATLYTGTGSALTVTNASEFKPDFVWLKSRSNSYNNGLFDSIRGVNKVLVSNSTDQEQTETAGSLSSFNSNGFGLGGGSANYAGVNINGATYVGWQWQAGQGSTSSNTSGSITSTVSVNTTAGFSIVTYTGNGTTATIGHGLGAAPKMILLKKRNTTSNWSVYHVSPGATQVAELNLTNAFSASGQWGNTAPTSTVFTQSADSGVNWLAYCWAEIAGFSKFGSYTGNGSADGPFVATNFAPKFILVKRTDSASDWRIWDTRRTPYNAMSTILYPNTSDADYTASTQDFDALSNGFKVRNSSAAMNASGGTYIYAAFAENPFKNSLAR